MLFVPILVVRVREIVKNNDELFPWECFTNPLFEFELNSNCGVTEHMCVLGSSAGLWWYLLGRRGIVQTWVYNPYCSWWNRPLWSSGWKLIISFFFFFFSFFSRWKLSRYTWAVYAWSEFVWATTRYEFPYLSTALQLLESSTARFHTKYFINIIKSNCLLFVEMRWWRWCSISLIG